jgi:hypothetical protein
MRSRLITGALGALALACPALAHATATSGEITASREAAVAYLRGQQAANGSFAGFGGEWTLTALAAAKVAAANVKTTEGATDARTYYRNLIGEPSTWPGGSTPPVTDFETAALAAYAAGIDPARVSANQNLIAQIVARQGSQPGYYGEAGFINGTVFGLLALADTHTTAGARRVPSALLTQSIEALLANQHTDGGWTFVTAAGNKEALEGPAEAELTGAAMAALCGAGVSPSSSAMVSARHFLAADLAAEPSGSGAFATEFGPNTDSNAWAVEGLNACGLPAQSAELTTAKRKTPIDFLISQQLAGGGFRIEPAETTPNLYSTQDALRALAKGGFTAPPPNPGGTVPRWVYQSTFTPGVAAEVTVIVNGTPPLRSCAVTLAPSTASTTLAAVLNAAKSSATPAGCVTQFAPESGNGAITQINGQTVAGGWRVSIDGGKELEATRFRKVGLGATIYLLP